MHRDMHLLHFLRLDQPLMSLYIIGCHWISLETGTILDTMGYQDVLRPLAKFRKDRSMGAYWSRVTVAFCWEKLHRG